MSRPQKTNREHLAHLIAEVPSSWKTNFTRVAALLLVASLLEPRVALTVGARFALFLVETVALVVAFAALAASIRCLKRQSAGRAWFTDEPRRLLITTGCPAAPVRLRRGDHQGARGAPGSAVRARAREGNLSEAREWEGAARAVLYPERRRRSKLRASDAERDTVIARLCEHAVAGRLDISELEERLSLALAARTRVELGALERDLPWLRH